MRFLPLTVAILLPAMALAHPEAGRVSGFVDGAAHPAGGVDHLLAMAAVGLWAAQAGGSARFWFPAAFLGGMLTGGLLALAQLPVPAIEPMILASVIVLGILIAVGLRVSPALGCALLAVFGLAHGAAHGVEANEGGLLYVSGFLLATALLHGLGFGLGAGLRRFDAPRLGRVLGGLAALAGAILALSLGAAT